MFKKYKEKFIGNREFYANLIRLIIPMIVQQGITSFVSLLDNVMVGRLGTESMSGVAIVNQLLFVFNLTIFGGLAGASIFGAQFYGKGDHKGVRYALRFKLIFSVLMAVIAIVALLFFNNPLISLFLTESESGGDLVLTLSEAKNYLFVMLIGLIPFSFSQSYSSTLRETGETVSPMTASIIAIVTNFVLNYILIFGSFGAPRLGVVGAAIATVVSQLFSGLLCTWWFFTRVEGIHFTRENCVLSAGHCGRLAYIGLPMGFEYSVSAIGAFIMQDAINLLGSTAVAAQTAGEKIRQMFTVPMASVGTAMATYVGQNHGAHRTDRVRQGIRDGCILQLCYCAAAWVVLFFVKGWAVGLVLGDADPAVTSGAVEYLTVISVLFCINGLLMVFRNTLQGLGYSVQAVISGVGELIGRALCGWLAVHSLGYFGICIANPIAWGLALLYCVFMVTRVLKKENA